jgi:hypothetical protein
MAAEVALCMPTRDWVWMTCRQAGVTRSEMTAQVSGWCVKDGGWGSSTLPGSKYQKTWFQQFEKL